jgi:hypothetical protein
VLRGKIWLVPFRDAIHFVVWLASFGSNRVIWGDVEYVVRQGKMVPVAGVNARGTNAAAHVPGSSK